MSLTVVATSSNPVELASEELEISVVMPCLNEANTVGGCVDKAIAALEALGARGEVIIADNGSTDGSRQIASKHGARVIEVARQGYGHALRAGIQAAHGAISSWVTQTIPMIFHNLAHLSCGCVVDMTL